MLRHQLLNNKTTDLKNERIPIDRPLPIQTFFGDGWSSLKTFYETEKTNNSAD